MTAPITQEAPVSRADQGIVARTILGAPEGFRVRSQDRLIGKLNPQEVKILAAAREKIDENDPAGALRVIAHEAPAITQTELTSKMLRLADPTLVATLGVRPTDIINSADARPVVAVHKYLERGLDSLTVNERKELMSTVKVALGDSVPYLQDLFRRTGVSDKEVDQLLAPLLQQDTFRQKLLEGYKTLTTSMDTLITERAAREKKISEAAQKLIALKAKEAIRTNTAPAAGTEEERIFKAYKAAVEDLLVTDPLGGVDIKRSKALQILTVANDTTQHQYDIIRAKIDKMTSKLGTITPALRPALLADIATEEGILVGLQGRLIAVRGQKTAHETDIKTAKDTWDALNTQFGFDALPVDQAGISGLTAQIKSEINVLASNNKPEWDMMIESVKNVVATAASTGFQESISKNKRYVDVAKAEVGDARKANAAGGALLLEKAWRNNKNTGINMRKAKKLMKDYVSGDPRNVNPEKFMEAIMKKDKRTTYPALEEMRTTDPAGYKVLAGQFMTDFVQDYIQGGGRFEEEVELSLYSSDVGKTLIDTALSNLGMTEADRAKLRYKERSALVNFIRSPKTWLTLGLLATGGYMAFGSTAAASVMASLKGVSSLAGFQAAVAPMGIGGKVIAGIQGAAYVGSQFIEGIVTTAKDLFVPSVDLTKWADDVIHTIYTPNSIDIESLGVQNSDVVLATAAAVGLTGATLIAHGKHEKRAAAEATRGAVTNSSPVSSINQGTAHE